MEGKAVQFALLSSKTLSKASGKLYSLPYIFRGRTYVATIGIDSSHTPCDGKRRLRPTAPRRGDARQGQNSRGAEIRRSLPGLPGALRSEAAYVGIQGRELSRRQGGRAGEVLQRPR